MCKRGRLSTFMVRLSLMGMRVALASYFDPFWLTYGPLYSTWSYHSLLLISNVVIFLYIVIVLFHRL